MRRENGKERRMGREGYGRETVEREKNRERGRERERESLREGRRREKERKGYTKGEGVMER